MSSTASSCGGAITRKDIDVIMTETVPPVREYDEITEINALESPLLRLPGELRQQIYEHAFANGAVEVLQGQSKFKGNPQKRRSKYAFGLRFTCRQLRAETRSTFFRNYTVDLTGCRGVLAPFMAIHPDDIISVESIRICWLVAVDIRDSMKLEEESAWTERFLKYVRDTCRSLKRVGIRELCILNTIQRQRGNNVVEALKEAFDKPDLEVFDACLIDDGACSPALRRDIH